MTISFLIEILIAGLLTATCIYCYFLSCKLKALRVGQEALLREIKKFDVASRRAEKNLQALKLNGVDMGRDLDRLTERASAAIDELSVMVRAGDHIAERIENVVQDVRGIGKRDAAYPERAA